MTGIRERIKQAKNHHEMLVALAAIPHDAPESLRVWAQRKANQKSIEFYEANRLKEIAEKKQEKKAAGTKKKPYQKPKRS